MIPVRGRNVGASKKWGQRVYCCYGVCDSNTCGNTQDSNIAGRPIVKLLPFPKPCSAFISSLIDNTKVHDIKKCSTCDKCTRWIHLCKRSDDKLRVLTDINTKTYICTKHFYDASGPTEEHPDPFPADKPKTLVDKLRSTARKRPADRQSPKNAKRLLTDTTSSIIRPTVSSTSAPANVFQDGPTVNKDDELQNDVVKLKLTTGTTTEHRHTDHQYCMNVNKSEPTSDFKKLAIDILNLNLLVQFNNETIRVALNTGVVCVIDRLLRVNIEVFGQILDNRPNHVVWSHIHRNINPCDITGTLPVLFQKLKEQWHACKCFALSNAAHNFVNLRGNKTVHNVVSDAVIQSTSCKKLCTSTQEMCTNCKKRVAFMERKKNRQKRSVNCRTNIKYLSRSEALECVKQSRRTLNLEKRKVARLRKRLGKLIEQRGTQLNNSDNEDFLKILVSSSHEESTACSNKIDMSKLFFQEQVKAAKGHRWHPLLLKWCLYLKSKSSSTYSALRKVITLPSEKRLYEIQEHTHIKPGFQVDVLTSLVKEFSDAGPESHRRYCSLLYDEMKIQEDLVYKASTNELIGYVRLSDVDELLNDIEYEVNNIKSTEKPLASHVLQLMVCGISSSILTTLAYFPTKTLVSRNLYTILWNAVEILEAEDIRVLAFVSDGAAANHSFYSKMNLFPGNKNVYCTDNPYSMDRKVYFVCDVPHLMKTTRNCFSNSGSHSKSRLLWKNNKHIEWKHVVEAYKVDLSDGLRKLSHISDEHVNLTPCSRMKVKSAVQVLSRRMGSALREQNSDHLSETITFVEIFNKWFDILNTRHLNEAAFSRNENLAPFTTPDGSRLAWLTGDFIEYLDEWERDVMSRPRDYTEAERSKMLLSRETIEGLKITARSVTAMTMFMLEEEGAPFILTYKFNQDPVELEFSKHRGAAGCNTNPNLMRYGDNTAKLKSMRQAKQELTFSGKGNITR